MILFKRFYVCLGDKETLANTACRKPTLTNHPADGFGMKAPTRMQLGRVKPLFDIITFIHSPSLLRENHAQPTNTVSNRTQYYAIT